MKETESCLLCFFCALSYILRQGVLLSQGQGRASRVRELTFTNFYGRHLLMQNKTTNIRKLTGTAMLGAVAAVLMYMEFPIPIMPSFVKLDVSELPALLAAYAYGPVSGIAVCLIKNLIKLPSTSTAAVGELFNFVMGALFVGVAGFVYKRSKTRRSALIGAGLGALAMAVVSVPYNYFIVYPAYVVLYHLPLEAIIGMYQAINPSVDGLLTCLITFNFPFTLFKGLLDAALCFLIYKPLSGVLHGRK
jgi:riboflavin transporter FmnP